MLIRVRCCVSHLLSFSRVWRLPSVWPIPLLLHVCLHLVVCVVPSVVLRNWCLVGMLGHVGHFLFQHFFAQ